MKTHWLYGLGPNKRVVFKHEIDSETDCTKCIHIKVCTRDTEKRCVNFDWSTSEGRTGCDFCINRFTRWDKDNIPCFKCNEFYPKKKKA